MAFQYKRRSAKDIEKRATQSGSDFQGYILDEYPLWTPKKGENWIRVLPATWEDADHYGMDVWLHYQVGPDKGTVLCLQKMKNKACPICEERSKLSAAGNEDEAKELKAGRRVLMYVIDRNEEAKGPQVWGAPWTLDRDIAKVSKDRRSGEMYFIDDPEEGYDVTFDKEGEGVATKYTGVQIARKVSSVSPKFIKQIDKSPLPETLRWRSYEEMEDMFSGGKDDDEDDRPKKKTKAPYDEDDDDDEKPVRKAKKPSYDDDDEDDERPVKKARSRKPVDDDEDDDDEDEKPVRKKVKKPVDDDDDEDDDPAPPKSSLRENLKKRREAEKAAPAKKKKPVVDDDDDDDDEIPF